MDTVTKIRRSEIMSRIRGKNTQPEKAVRRFLRASGLHFHTHRRDLPGKPDFVFPGRRLCLFVHGCFWHGCPRCIDGTRKVRSNKDYWSDKVRGNKARDMRNARQLRRADWHVMTIWECQISEKQLTSLIKRIGRIKAMPKTS